MSSLPENQQMARVTVSEERWLEFRALAIRSKRSVAGYLGHLVQKELNRAERVEWKREMRQRREAPPEAEVRPANEVAETWVPPWEL